MESGEGKKKKGRKKKLLIVLAALLLLAAAVPAVVMYVAKSFTAQETVVRTDWTTDVGEVFGGMRSSRWSMLRRSWAME